MAELVALIICFIIFSPVLFLPFVDDEKEDDHEDA